MAAFDLAKTVVVFDLDDTLYSEADYVYSGMRHVCSQLEAICGTNPYASIQKAMEAGNKDWLALACELVGWRTSAKESLLWMYRLHTPQIHLSADCRAALHRIKSHALAVAVLTDGRSVTQRLKLKVLGIGDWPAYISEDYGADKPDPTRYLAIQQAYDALHYVYIGDNAMKDFYACNRLGWTSICLRGAGRNVHFQSVRGLPTEALPTYWADDWSEVVQVVGFTGFC